MPVNCEAIVASYLASLRNGFHIESHQEGCVIVTPLLRPDGDYIEVLVEERQSGSLYLTDMGDTLAYLHLNGLSLSRRLMDDSRRICQRFGVEISINEITIETTSTDIGTSLHDLAQAAVNIAALVEKRRPYANLRFEEEVEATIIAQGRSYDLQYPVPGAREPHTVRFHINSGLRILAHPFSQAQETSARNLAERWNYHFNDILAANPDWRIYALLDDRGDRQAIWRNPHVIVPLQGLATIVKWSERDRFIDAIKVENQADYDELLP